jgi:hypothetical protein
MADLKPVARCTTCGREFVTLPNPDDMIDHFPPRGRRIPPYRRGDPPVPECGGTLVLLPKPNKPTEASDG